jgi:hypothetical protein
MRIRYGGLTHLENSVEPRIRRRRPSSKASLAFRHCQIYKRGLRSAVDKRNSRNGREWLTWGHSMQMIFSLFSLCLRNR